MGGRGGAGRMGEKLCLFDVRASIVIAYYLNAYLLFTKVQHSFDFAISVQLKY